MSTIRATAFAIADRIVVVEVPVEFAGQEVLICLASEAVRYSENIPARLVSRPVYMIDAPEEKS